ncbi:TFIIIC transcription initiation factor complex subunits Tfc3 [Colletotrichum tofieldiae]|nr:TFIIIC transcription initiation factor complex subunits Tfc3 [Colletotrichum tofieldiae]
MTDRSLTISGWMPDSRWFLKQNLPQNLTEMIKWRGRPKTNFPSSSQYYEFAERVDACFDWELSSEGMKLLLAESIAPDHIFINHGIGDLPGELDSPPLEWDPANQLSPSALFDIQISEQATTATDHLWGGELGRQRRRKRRQNKLATEPKELVIGIDLKTRTLIPLPRDMDPRDVSRRNAGLDETNETILIAAFVVTRTLLGGADRIIEWGLMMTLFPDMALSAMRRFWSKARKDRGTFINQLTERFQIQFISAYENNEFPPIDFDKYIDYDWPRLIKWTAGLIEDSQELPASKAALERGYSLGSAWTDVTNWRDDYYNFQMSVFNRFEAATSRPATSLVDRNNELVSKSDADDLVTAMSWLRSLCYTHRDRYAPQDIRKKMASIGGGNEDRIQSLLEQAVETLQGQGVITDSKLKALEGRPYRLTETFLPRFMKWTHEVKFIDAARFKSQLDGASDEEKKFASRTC